jgi:hypothetical protein
LLVLTALCGLLLAPVVVEFNRYRREAAALERLAGWDGRGPLRISSSIPTTASPYVAAMGRANPMYKIVPDRAGFLRVERWWGMTHSIVGAWIDGPVTLADIQAIGEFSSLDHLAINHSALPRSVLEGIARLSSLEMLDLSGCQIPEDELQPLAQLRKLKSLQLHNTGVPESAIFELQEALPGLEVLDD